MTLAKLIAKFVKEFGRKPQGMEMIRLRQIVKNQPAEVIPFPKEKITDWTKPRPHSGPLLEDSPEQIKQIIANNKRAAQRLRDKKKTEPKVYKEGDKGFDEISEKLGITAKPGHPLTLEGKADLKLVKPKKKKDRLSIRLIKNFDQELDDITLAQEGYNLQEIGILQRARNVMKKEGQNPDDALTWVRGEMADDAGVDIEDFMTDFDWGDFPGTRDFQSGGLAYMLGEPNTRIEALQHAGVVADPRGLYTDPAIYSKGEEELQNFYEGGGVGHGPWTRGQAPRPPEQAPRPGAPMHPAQGQSNPMKLPRGLPSLAPRTMDPQYMQQQRMQQMMAGMGQRQQRPMAAEGGRMGLKKGSMRDRLQKDYKSYARLSDYLKSAPPKFWLSPEKYGVERDDIMTALKERFMYGDLDKKAEGGIMRMGFKKGGDMSRRGFMKLIAGLAALPVVGKYFKAAKLAKPAAAVTETIVKSNAAGMPAWFPSLVRRVIKEGEDITKTAGTIERQTVHTIKLPESGTPVQVTRDLVTDDIIVDIGEQTKHGWGSGRHGQPAQLILKKGEWIEPTKGKKGI